MGTPELGFSTNTGLPCESVYHDYNTHHRVLARPASHRCTVVPARTGRPLPYVWNQPASGLLDVLGVLDEAEVLRHLVVQRATRRIRGVGQPVHARAAGFTRD